MSAVAYRAELWDLPHKTPWNRLHPSVKYKELVVTVERDGEGFGRLITNTDDISPFIDTINGHGSFVRIFDDADVNVASFKASKVDVNWEENGQTQIWGPGPGYILDKMIIQPKNGLDGELDEHIWGGDNRLQNPGMEEAGEQYETYKLWFDENVTSFTLTVMGQTTSPITIGDSASSVELDLQALSTVNDVLVTAGDTSPGTENNPYQIEFIDPFIVDPDMTVTPTGGEATLDVIDQGRDDVPRNWEKSQFIDRSSDIRLHGRYASNGFKMVEAPAPVRSGTKSLRVNGLTIYAGAQQVVNVTEGEIFQCSIWVWSSDATAKFKLIIRDQNSNVIRSPGGAVYQDEKTITVSTWTQYSVSDVIIPEGVEKVIFRIAVVGGDDNPVPYYLDDAEMLEGEQPTTIGDIFTTLISPIQTRGVGTWLDVSTIDSSTDSANVAWDSSARSITVPPGESIRQLLDAFTELWKYEWIVEWDDSLNSYALKIYNSGGMGQDRSATLKFWPRDGWTPSKYSESLPTKTALLGLGEEGVWAYEQQATQILNDFGLEEAFAQMPNVGIPDTVTLTDWLTNELAKESDEYFGFRVNGSFSHRFGTDWDIGDTAVWSFPGTHLGDQTKRVHNIQIRAAGSDEQNLSITVDVVRKILIEPPSGTTSTATSFVLNRLLRRFNRRITSGGSRTALDTSLLGTSAEQTTGAYLHLERAATQSIPNATDTAIEWDLTSGILEYHAFVPSVPGTGITIPKQGYYDFGISLQMAATVESPAVRISRVRGSSDVTVWPPASDPGVWSVSYPADTFSNVAKGIPCVENDVITVYLQHNDGAAVDLSKAILSAEMVDTYIEEQSSVVMVHNEVPPRGVAFAGEVLFDKTFKFFYDGISTVWLSGTPDGEGTWWVDNLIDIYVDHEDTSQGSPYPQTIDGGGGQNPGPENPQNPVDITSLFERGTNDLRVVVRDTTGFDIGCSDLWIVGI